MELLLPLLEKSGSRLLACGAALGRIAEGYGVIGRNPVMH